MGTRKGKTTYAVSCDSAKILGVKVAQSPYTAYIGYMDEFIFACDRNYFARPIEDPRAKPFKDSSNQVVLALLKGHRVADAFVRSQDAFLQNYTKLLASTADSDSVQTAQFLWWNRRNQVCLGDQNLSPARS